jgi:hypothetical protein
MNHRSHTHALVAAALLNLLAGSAHAATLDVEVSLPTIASAAYHYPYLAAWIERADDQSAAGTLAVWYDQRLRDGLGKLFLHDLRSWWRKTGAERRYQRCHAWPRHLRPAFQRQAGNTGAIAGRKISAGSRSSA